MKLSWLACRVRSLHPGSNSVLPGIRRASWKVQPLDSELHSQSDSKQPTWTPNACKTMAVYHVLKRVGPLYYMILRAQVTLLHTPVSNCSQLVQTGSRYCHLTTDPRSSVSEPVEETLENHMMLKRRTMSFCTLEKVVVLCLLAVY